MPGHDDTDGHQHYDEQASGLTGIPGMRLVKRQAGDTSAEHFGWSWKMSAHGALANVLLILLLLQVGMGVYRKLTKTKARLQLSWLSGSAPKKIHSYLGKAHLILAYIQIVLGVIKLLEACPGQAFGQCISHIVMVRRTTICGLGVWAGCGECSQCPIDTWIPAWNTNNLFVYRAVRSGGTAASTLHTSWAPSQASLALNGTSPSS